MDRRCAAAADPEQAPSSQQPAQQQQQLPAGTIQDLPLWRVQWAVLPGMQNILHVHVPHYVHMFETVFRGGRPWRFGHLYLPGEQQGPPASMPTTPGLACHSSLSAPRVQGTGTAAMHLARA